MDFLGESLLCKAKSLVSSFCGIMLWVSKLPCPTQTPTDFPTHHQYLQLGLKTLLYPQAMSPQNGKHHAGIVHSKTVSHSFLPKLTSSSSGSSIMDDWIGTESGVVYFSSSEYDKKEMEEQEAHSSELHVNYKTNQRCAMMTKNYPPPVRPLPWAFTRHYSDGKLILRMKHHEYFEARRENGRLRLNLVHLEDTITCCEDAYFKENEELQLEDLQFVDDQEMNEMIEEDDDVEEYEETEADYDGYDGNNVAETVKEDFVSILASSMPVQCFTYVGGMVLNNSNSYCNANNHEHVAAYLAHPGSSPLCPMTAVV